MALQNRLYKIAVIIVIFALLISPCLPINTVAAANELQSSVYSVDRSGGLLKHIGACTSVSNLKCNLHNEGACIHIYAKDGSEYTGDAVATGMAIKLVEKGTVQDTLKLCICGDPSGDGNISISDYTLARLHILNLKSLQDEYSSAADVNNDGKISISDYTLMRLHILGLKTIKPGVSALPLSGVVIGLDPGHQHHANSELELVSPKGTEKKKKVSSGTQGRFTNVPEYVINLQAGLKLKTKLEELGATVIMSRETHDVDISNSQRAIMMNEANVDCWLRIHADGSSNPDKHGVSILIPTPDCMNTTDESIAQKSQRLASILIEHVVGKTGAKNNGTPERGDQTGFCWSARPVCNIEMGYMTNEAEDSLLVTEEYQDKIVAGLTDGFVEYFGK